MKISNYLKEEFCIMDLGAEDKEQAIRKIADKLNDGRMIVDKESFIKDVLERESLGSTGIGHSVAIPHARTAAVKKFVIGFGKSKDGIEFDSLDGQRVNIVFLMGSDPKELNLYLRLLAELSKLLMSKSFRESLMKADTASEVIKVINDFEQ